jgi:hypothetical protein
MLTMLEALVRGFLALASRALLSGHPGETPSVLNSHFFPLIDQTFVS